MPRRASRASRASVLLLAVACGTAAGAQKPAIHTTQKEAAMASHASGQFEVKVKPLPNDEKVEGLTVGRMELDKQWKGDLEGTSKGEMMTASTSVEGSAGYVALEQVTAKLKGRGGSFMLLHQGTMQAGKYNLAITVVPDSGTGELTGLAGTLVIVIADGKHSYEFEYTLPVAP